VTENQIILLFCVFAMATRIPRILERWKAPLLRGPGWFFGVAVPADFPDGPGAAILRSYRLRLFLPWAVELPICAGFLLTGHDRYIIPLIGAITLLTRLNYYAIRKAAEDRAERFGLPGESKPVMTVALSLQPRTLRAYTTWWMEATIAAALGGALLWLGYRYAVTRDWQLVRQPFAVTALMIYVQAGLLLLKRAMVRARSIAPAENAAQYLAWRDSLRRLSTAMCDYVRIIYAFIPLVMELQFVPKIRASGSTAQTIAALAFIAGGTLATWYEWRHRLRYLEVARQTKPAKLLVLPDVPDAGWLVCFRPSLPVLLLNGPKGYAVNLASAPARFAGLYIAGYAALQIFLRSQA
jgi:hypothetical protein